MTSLNCMLPGCPEEVWSPASPAEDGGPGELLPKPVPRHLWEPLAYQKVLY